MPYTNPGFVNGSSPALNASNLNDIADTLECVPVENGGTGATTAANARNNLGLNTAGVNALVNGNALPVANGGTGATTVAEARNALGLGNSTGALPIANGGTGQTTVAAARNALGLGNTTGALPVANGGTGATSVAGARNALGLGNTTGALPIANGGTGATTIAGARNALGLGNTSGALPIANGGTGATTQQAARGALGLNTSGISTLVGGNPLEIPDGGTGSNSKQGARDNLGLTDMATAIPTDVMQYVSLETLAGQSTNLNVANINRNCITRNDRAYFNVTLSGLPSTVTVTDNFHVITFRADSNTRKVQFLIPETGTTVYMIKYHGSSNSGWKKISFTAV